MLRERAIAVVLSFALVLGLCVGCRAQEAGLSVPFRGLPRIQLSFDLTDAGAPMWKAESASTERAVYTWHGHRLALWLERNGVQQLLRFRLDAPRGKSLSVRTYSARLALPTTGLHAVLYPNARKIAQDEIYYEYYTWPECAPLYHCLIPESFRETANANSDAPFILLTDPKGNSALAAGWTKPSQATQLSGNAVGDSYQIELARADDIPFAASRLEDALVVSTAPEFWFDAVRAYARTFDRLNGRRAAPLPEWTTEPVFDTWYCYGDRMNQTLILNVARKCKELGIGTLLIDAGWDSPSDCGYIRFEDGVLGDYLAERDRFPDLAEAIRLMHKMGLRVELWCAPFWQGKLSWAYRNVTGTWHIRTPEGEHHCLCPRVPKLPGYLEDRFAWIARTYDCDGMWLDAGDNVPAQCLADHEHVAKPMGEAFVECMAAARRGLRSVTPDAIIEVRPLHGNLNSKVAFDLIQPSDAPDKLDTQRMSVTEMRAWANEGSVKSDPIRWGKKAGPATVGKLMATAVCLGTPALSVDWLTATDEQLKVARAWLDFYHRHKSTLRRGEFRPCGATYWNPDMMFMGKDEAILYLRSPETREISLPRAAGRVIVVNSTGLDVLDLGISSCSGRYSAQSYSPDWTASGAAVQLDAPGTIRLSQPVPQGGAAVIERRGS